MQKIILLLLSFSVSFCFSQNNKSVKSTKHGYAKVTKVAPDNTVHHEDARIIFSFTGPDHKPAKSHIKVVCNHDSAWPEINVAGQYTAEVEPGKYKMRFSVPFWHEVTLDSIMCKKKTATSIHIQFEPQDFKAGPVKH